MPSGKNPLMLMMALSVPGAAHAIGLGDIHVDSALNENFAAEIDIVGATALQLTDLRASIANREVFLRMGADRPAFLSSATFKVIQDSRGRPVLAVRSSESFTEPVVNFLVDLNWHDGELVRQYTVLLDPAEYSHTVKAQFAAQAPAAAPVIAAPAALAEEPVADAALPEAAVQNGRKTTHIKVGAKATLRGIAWRVGERSPSDLQKMMIAIFRANPAAFDGNINRLHRGALLTIPAHAELGAISKLDARGEFHVQMAEWRSGTRVASTSAASAAPATESTAAPAAAIAAASVPAQSAAAQTAAAGATGTEVLDRQVKSLEQELNNLKGVLHSTDTQLQSLQEQAARAEKPAFAEKPALAEKLAVAGAPLAVVAPAPRAKSDFAALSIVGGLGVLGSALAALYFRMRRRTTPARAVNPGSIARAAGPAPLALSSISDSMAETIPRMAALHTKESAVAITYGPVQDHMSAVDTGDTHPDLQAILEPRRSEATQPLLPIISTGEPAGKSSIAGGSFSRAQDPSVNMRADQGTVRMDPTRLDYNLLDLDMTAQHVHLPSELNEPVRKERRTNLADVLKLAIEREPERHDLRLKLLELYYSAAATNRQGFLDAVQKFAHERQHLTEDQWERIASMGRQIAAENPMFVDQSLTEDAEDDLADCA